VAGLIVATRGGGIVEFVEAGATQIILGLKLVVELVGALVIGVGCVSAMIAFIRTRRAGSATYTGVRLLLARYIALGLEFQLAADILVTAVAPSWEEIGKLAAIAAIRTLLNFFLAREMKDERAEAQEESAERVVEARDAQSRAGLPTVQAVAP
jgi:uncharacterized membrane protein